MPKGGKVKILIVEDEAPLREMYQMRLEMEGYKTVGAADGEEGMEKAISEKPDLILLDLLMPNVSGTEMYHLLKSNEKTKNIPVIILTALSSPRYKKEIPDPAGYIIKSEATLEDVVDEVNRVLGKK